MNAVLLLLLAAAPPTATPTPTPTPRLNILLTRESQQGAPATGSLADVAKQIKLKLPEGQPRVLTNDSVKQLSQGVELTTGKATGASASAPIGAPSSQESPKKAMWQQRYQDAVNRVAALEAEIKRLEGESARLERDFYAHDDPHQRDGIIKPAWDKTVNDLRRAQAELAEARNKPNEVLEAARRDGALPGWFRGLDQPSQPGAKAPGPARRAPATPVPIPPGPS